MTELDRHHFDHLLTERAMLTVTETARLVGMSEQTVIDACDAGRIHCHVFNGGTGIRMTRRVPRHAVVLFLLQTKAYNVEDYLAGVIGLLSVLAVPELRRVQEVMPRILEQAQARKARGIPSL